MGTNGNRVPNDFYKTPRDATTSLLHYEGRFIPQTVLEPACGDGAVSEVLKEFGYTVESSDLIDRNYGTPGIDFLRMKQTSCQGLITNPPFKLADEFIEHALGTLGITYMALLLKTQFWNVKKRHSLYMQYTPAKIYPMTWRPDFLNTGHTMMECMWCIWRPHTVTEYEPMARIKK